MSAGIRIARSDVHIPKNLSIFRNLNGIYGIGALINDGISRNLYAAAKMGVRAYPIRFVERKRCSCGRHRFSFCKAA